MWDCGFGDTECVAMHTEGGCDTSTKPGHVGLRRSGCLRYVVNRTGWFHVN
jgi:hypothetical protein